MTLAVVMAAAGTTAMVVLSGYFSSSVAREEENAVRLHSYLASGIEGGVIWQRISDGVPRLSSDRVKEVLEKQLEGQESIDSFLRVCVLDGSGKVLNAEKDGKSPALPEGDWKTTDVCAVMIREAEGKTELTVGSRMVLEGETYLLCTVSDVSQVYGQYRSQLRRSLFLTMSFAFGASLVLLALCWLLLKPLTRVNRALKKIAGGDYARRLPETGGAELRELSRNVNLMAASIEEQTGRLQRTADSRKRFADSMAHEMKTPLTSILCMADLLRIRTEVSEEERREYAGLIVEEAKRMQALSSKLLTLASADGASLDLRPVSLLELMEDVRNAMEPILSAKGIRLTVAGDDGVLTADRQLFETLLINLIDNAAKASKEGDSVTVIHTLQGGNALIAVADEGIGMDAETLRHATEPFYMADKARSRRAGGAGLGLFLCAEVARLHGALLRLESELGKGTTVTLTLPCAEANTEPEGEKEKSEA